MTRYLRLGKEEIAFIAIAAIVITVIGLGKGKQDQVVAVAVGKENADSMQIGSH